MRDWLIEDIGLALVMVLFLLEIRVLRLIDESCGDLCREVLGTYELGGGCEQYMFFWSDFTVLRCLSDISKYSDCKVVGGIWLDIVASTLLGWPSYLSTTHYTTCLAFLSKVIESFVR